MCSDTTDLTPMINEILGKDTIIHRRNLLVASTFGLLLSYGGLIPHKITVMGFEFPNLAQGRILDICLLIIIYFAIEYAFHAAADFVSWKRRRSLIFHNLEVKSYEWSHDDQEKMEQAEALGYPAEELQWYYRWVPIFAKIKAFWTFGIPPIWSGLSVVAIVNSKIAC